MQLSLQRLYQLLNIRKNELYRFNLTFKKAIIIQVCHKLHFYLIFKLREHTQVDFFLNVKDMRRLKLSFLLIIADQYLVQTKYIQLKSLKTIISFSYTVSFVKIKTKTEI